MCVCVCCQDVVSGGGQKGAVRCGAGEPVVGEMLESGMGETKEASWFTELVQSEEKYF